MPSSTLAVGGTISLAGSNIVYVVVVGSSLFSPC